MVYQKRGIANAIPDPRTPCGAQAPEAPQAHDGIQGCLRSSLLAQRLIEVRRQQRGALFLEEQVIVGPISVLPLAPA